MVRLMLTNQMDSRIRAQNFARKLRQGSTSRGETPIRAQLSTPKFGTLYHFTKVSVQ